MCRRAALCLLVVVWLCAAVCGVDAGSSEAHSGEDERSFDKLWVSTSSAPLNIDARRWLISRMGPQGVIAPGRLNLVNFSRPEGQRFFHMYVPRTYTASKAWPLAVFYHGYVASWMQGAYLFNMTMDAERAGYLLIFAQGSPGLAGLAWEAGLCCLFNESSLVDDIAYTRTALDLARTAVNVDSDRVYAMGWSNGGHMVERMACEAPELFAGVAVAGSAIIVRPGGVRGLASCDRSFGSSSSLNYLHLHGTADSAVPWDGGIVNASTQLVVSTAENVARWVARLGCDAAVQQTYKEGSFSNQLWSHCRHGRQVELMTVENGQHTWWTLQEGRFQTTSYALNFFTRTHSEQKKKSGLGGLLDVFH